jgi:hypothetical protein
MSMDKKDEKTMPGMAPSYTTNNNGRITVGSKVERLYIRRISEYLGTAGFKQQKDFSFCR